LDYATLSDIGLRRSNNQDSLTVSLAGSEAAWRKRGDLFMVADGMGAHAAGELASKLATDTVPLAYSKLTDRSPPEAARAAVEEANALIHSRGQASEDFKGMGTTCTTLILLPQGALVAHVGDSRCYRLRGSRIEQLTFDHSLVWEMRAVGQIRGPVPDFIPKNVITRSLGPHPAVQVDVEGPHPILAGDTFFLCSDGLSGPVHDEEIGILLGVLAPSEAAAALVDLANLRGGPDNISVLVVRAVGSQWAEAGGGALAGPRRKARPVHPAAWIATGVLALAGLGLLAVNALVAAVTLAAAAAVGGGVFLYRRGGPAATLVANGQRLGAGPYTAAACEPGGEFVGRLAQTAGELRKAAAQGEMPIDWKQVEDLLQLAVTATQAADHAEAVRQYCKAIRFMMAGLKRQGRSRSGNP
jgi:protein phosphatase